MEKTTKNGIHRISQEGGKTIAWAEESGVKVLEKDGYYFKDLAKTGELLPYEDWRLSDEERAADLAGRLSIEEIAGLMLYSPHQAVPPMPGGPFQGTFDGKTYLESGKEPYAISDQQKEFLEEMIAPNLYSMFVTPKDVDETVKYLSFTISEGLNIAFSEV